MAVCPSRYTTISSFRINCQNQKLLSGLRYVHSTPFLLREFRATTFLPLWIPSPLLYPHKLLWFIVWRRLWKPFFCSHRCNKQWAAENTDSHKWVRLWHDSDLNTCCPVQLCSRVLKLCQLWWIWLSSADDDMIKEATKGVRTTLERTILIRFKAWELCRPRSGALKGDILCSSVSFLSCSHSV